MSYALEFAPEAREAWRRLDVALQELVLDRLAGMTGITADDRVHDLVVDSAEATHYLFLRLTVAGANLVVTNIGHFARPH
jgi:hypothetical protein